MVPALGGQQKGRPHRRFCAGERGLVLFDGGFNAGKTACHRGNGVLLQGSRIATRRHFEVTISRGFERGSYGCIHVRCGLAGLGMRTDRSKFRAKPPMLPAAATTALAGRGVDSDEPPVTEAMPKPKASAGILRCRCAAGSVKVLSQCHGFYKSQGSIRATS